MEIVLVIPVPVKKAPATYVPPAGVIGRDQAFSGITGVKGR